MESTTVTVQIQFDTLYRTKESVLAELDVINNALQNSGLSCSPQILTSGVDDSDINFAGDEESEDL